MRKITILTAVIFISILPGPGRALDFDGRGGGNFNEELAALEALTLSPAPSSPAASGQPQKEWTIMVFMNGKNNLAPEALMDINEMETLGSSDKVNIVVQAGRVGGYDAAAQAAWKGVRRYYITRDEDPAVINSRLAEDMGDVDMGDWRNMAEFGNWAKANYPARKYAFIAWNHGSGWKKGVKRLPAKGISFDERSGNHMTTPELGYALKAIGGVDVFGSDACLMQMAEVVYEIKDSAKYVIGSEEVSPANGYVYDRFLVPVLARPEMSPEELARTAVDTFSDYYQSLGEASTQSLIRMSAVTALTAKLNDFVAAVIRSGDRDAFNRSRVCARSYREDGNVDLYDLAALMAANTKDAGVAAAADALKNFISGKLVVHNRITDYADLSAGDAYDYWPGESCSSRSYERSRGLAVYAPATAGVNDGYGELAWARDSKWDEFIAWYAAK